MSSAAAFLELRQFLGGLEISSRKLRESLQEKNKVFGVQGDVFVDGLAQTVVGVQSRLNDIETSVSGPPESRLSQVTMLEILQKCKAVHHANDAMLSALTAKLTKRGAWNAATAAVENQENVAPTVNSGGAYAPVTEHVVDEADASADAVSPAHEALLAAADEALPDANTNDADAVTDAPAASEEGLRRLSTAPHTPGGAGARENDEEARTPVLPDWKLSEATRNLVNVNNGPGYHTQRKEPLQRHVPQTADKYAARSPAPKRAATATKAAAAAAAAAAAPREVGAPMTPARDMNLSRISVSQSFDLQMQLGAEEDEPDMLTPQPVEKSVHLQQMEDDGTPKTPTLGTPFHTCRLRDAPGDRGVARKLDVDAALAPAGPGSAARNGGRKAAPARTPEAPRGARGAAGKVAPKTGPVPAPSIDAEDAAADVSGVSDIPSPPKMTIPRKRTTDVPATAAVATAPFVAPVTAEDWASVPPFLCKQTSAEKVDAAVAALNRFLADGGAAKLSAADMDRLMDKPVALILSNLKRFDVGTENGVKVYKMKKY